MKNKKMISVGAACLLLSALVSCGSSSGDTGKPAGYASSVSIRLEGDTVSCDDPSVFITDDLVTITTHGTYVVSGTWNDGQIRVECVDGGELNLVLDNARISNNDQACIVFQKAQKAVLTLADGSENMLTDGAVYTFENPLEDEPDAPLFSKEDLVIEGNGSLAVVGNYKNGIVSKDGLTIDGGTVAVSSVDHGIKGKDSLVINGGNVTVMSAGDGLKTTNEESELVGSIEINGGTVNVYSDDEAIQATTNLTVNGGDVNISSTNNGIRCEGVIAFNGGTVNIEAEDKTMEAEDVTVSDKASVTIFGYPYKG